MARVVATGIPHRITQRESARSLPSSAREYECYRQLMAKYCCAEQVEIWAYCLVPNHVRLIALPQSADGTRRAIGNAHSG